MARPVLPEVEVGAQVICLDVPYRISAYAAKTSGPAVPLQMERIGYE